jgi:hypothetical protein
MGNGVGDGEAGLRIVGGGTILVGKNIHGKHGRSREERDRIEKQRRIMSLNLLQAVNQCPPSCSTLFSLCESRRPDPIGLAFGLYQ